MAETKEMKIINSDPTPLGVFGLAMITLVAASAKLGWTDGTTYAMTWALFLGSIGQIWAAKIDFKRNNFYGAIVLGSFGLFWAAVALTWAISNGFLGDVPANADLKQFGYACLGYMVFSIFFAVASWEVNKVFGTILTLIVVLLGALGLSLLGIAPAVTGPIAGWTELAISILGFYAAGALFLNGFFGRVLLPLGKPMGWLKKTVS